MGDQPSGSKTMKAVRLRVPWVFPKLSLLLHNGTGDLVSDYIGHNRAWELDQTILVMKYVNTGWNVIDVGANVGYYTLLFSRCVGRRGRVFALEPEPQNLEVLRANAARSRPRNIEVLGVALSDTSGPGLLYKSSDNLGDHRLAWREGCKPCAVELARADDLFADLDCAFQLIKVDVQGAEERVLRGMRRLIERNARHLAVFIEFSPALLIRSGSSPDAFIDQLDELGSRVMRFTSDAWRSVRVWSADGAELRGLTDRCLADPDEGRGENLLLFFSPEAELRFRQRMLEPWPGPLARLWRWSGFA
jgi:FkbM family methyltransferase